MSNKKIFVFAECYADYLDFLRANNLFMIKYAYIYDAKQLRGFSNIEYLVTKNYMKHEKFNEIISMLHARLAKRIKL